MKIENVVVVDKAVAVLEEDPADLEVQVVVHQDAELQADQAEVVTDPADQEEEDKQEKDLVASIRFFIASSLCHSLQRHTNVQLKKYLYIVLIL